MVYRFECKKCGKVYEDTSEGRFKYNVEQHKLKHKRENDRKRKARGKRGASSSK